MNDEILLTVWCETYNFGDYIRDALEGFIAQRTSFRYQVYIYDDASTDNSADIIEEYMEKYPDIIKGYLSKKNTYGKPERHELIKKLKIENVKGKYYALCEGDDYWIDVYKLQKQVDFLEKHSDVSMTVHASRWIDYSTGKEYDVYAYKNDCYIDDEHLICITNGDLATASYVYRINDFDMDNLFKVSCNGDYALRLYERTKGKIYYFNDVMSVYRYKHTNSWSLRASRENYLLMKTHLQLQSFLYRYDEYTNYKYHLWVRKAILSWLYDPMLLDTCVSVEEYIEYIKKSDFASEPIIEKVMDEKIRIARILRGEYVLSDEESRRIKENRKIVIYGCGIFSNAIKSMLKMNGIEVDGCVISDDRSIEEVDSENKIWKLSEYPYDINNTLIIIGLHQKNEESVNKYLEEYGIYNIWMPLWFQLV